MNTKRQKGRRRLVGWLLAVAATVAMAVPLQAAQYIRDVVYVPLRSGAGSQYRIIDNLRSGTAVEVVGGDPAGYVQVTTASGATGWLEAQYLVDQPVAAQRLKQLQAQFERLKDRNAALEESLRSATGERETAAAAIAELEQSERQLTEELQHIRTVSADSLRLSEERAALVAENSDLSTTARQLQAENDRLAQRLERDDFMRGAYAVGMGVVLTVVVPYIWPRRRRRSEWA